MKKLLKFYAPWCAPCTALGKVITEANVADLTIQEINIDDEPELAAQYGVRSIPTLIMMNGNEVSKKKSGLMNKEEFTEFVR